MKTHIILNEKGQPMETCEYEPGKPVLSNGDRAETFTYSTARRMIARSIAYAEAESLPWNAKRYRLMRLR